MSLDLIVLPKDSATEVADALAVYLGTGAGVRNPESVRAFAAEVAATFETDGLWPWTGPMDVYETHLVLHPAHESWEEIVVPIASLAAQHGLIALDPQASCFVPPGGYEMDLAQRWDMLVIDPGLVAFPKRMQEIRDSGDSGIDAKERLPAFIAEAETALGTDAWEAKLTPTTAVLSIPLARWKEVARAVSEIAERNGLRAWVPDGNPPP